MLYDDIPVEIKIEENDLPSRTFALDFEKGRILSPLKMIEGLDAIKQFVIITLQTERFAYPIFDNSVGIEKNEILKSNLSEELIKSELSRTIKESLVYDERIDDVIDFKFNFNNEVVNVEFVVVTSLGNFKHKETFNNE